MQVYVALSYHIQAFCGKVKVKGRIRESYIAYETS